jgi:hypothetical protein
VKLQESPLPFGKATDVDGSLHIDPHALQRRLVRDSHNIEIAAVLETDESPAKQVVDAGRKQ